MSGSAAPSAQGVIANVKHFRQQPGGPERADGRAGATGSTRVDERTLVELYLSQFEAAVKEGHAGSVMCSYNRLNGRTRARAGGC